MSPPPEVAASTLFLANERPPRLLCPLFLVLPPAAPPASGLFRGDVTGCLPLCLQSAFSQLRLTPGLRKVLFATALGTVALALAAHQLKRRRRRKKQVGPEMGGEHLGTVPLPILMARKVPSMKKGRPEALGKGLTWCQVPAGPLLAVGFWARRTFRSQVESRTSFPE